MTTEVASTRLPREIVREIDRAASARGISRSVYLAELIEQGTVREPSPLAIDQAETLSALASGLREIREAHRSVAHGLREFRITMGAGGASGAEMTSPLLERVAFSTFFSEALIKRISALLCRNPSELSQVVREARDQAQAEANLWRQRLQAHEGPQESS